MIVFAYSLAVGVDRENFTWTGIYKLLLEFIIFILEQIYSSSFLQRENLDPKSQQERISWQLYQQESAWSGFYQNSIQ